MTPTQRARLGLEHERPYEVVPHPLGGWVAVQKNDADNLIWVSQVRWDEKKQADSHCEGLELLRQRTIGEMNGQQQASPGGQEQDVQG